MTAVAIVTLGGDTNYGNRLQNFALQEALSGLGVASVETMHGLPQAEPRVVKAQRLMLTGFARRKELVSRLRRKGRSHPSDSYYCPPERQLAIREFTDQYIHRAPRAYREVGPGPDGLGRYSHFVVGSDQVWNPAYTHVNPEWFLSFAPEERRIAYAASFGIPAVPPYAAARYRRGLRGLAAVSVREQRASEMVRELARREAPVVLDPTMLLAPGRWNELARTPQCLVRRRYVAQFMLAAGDGTPSPGADLGSVAKFARDHELEIADLHDPVEPELLSMGPLEFIGAIRESELVVTDSFHTAVFALLFHRPFLLVQRGAMNSRFETLLSHVGLEERFLIEARGVDEAPEIDWDDVDRRLAVCRKESLAFLGSSIGTTR